MGWDDSRVRLRSDRPARGTVSVGTDQRRGGDRIDDAIELGPHEDVVVALEA